jgi:hypothetical protein
MGRRNDRNVVDADDFDDALEHLHEKLRTMLKMSSDVPWALTGTLWRSHIEEAAKDFLEDCGVRVADVPKKDRVG